MSWFAHRNATHRLHAEPQEGLLVDNAPPLTAAEPPRPRLLRRHEPRRHSLLGWALALGAGVAIAVVAVSAWEDPRSVGAQLDGAVASVRNAGSQAGQTVVHSQNAAAQASRDVVDGVSMAIDDAGISAKVKAALAVDPALSASRIEVQTDQGIVRLAGPAPDAAAKERATVLAAAPQGVRGVDNRLTLPQPGHVVAVADK
ncbi:MAG: BON domain-containing protein [Burkholderiales bacterium]|nr:BON domain-containing protein [Burkholderiales bacterium]